MHGQIDLVPDQDIGIPAVQVRKEVQREDYGAIGGVFKWDDAVCGLSGLYGGEDVFDCGQRPDIVFWSREMPEGGLERDWISGLEVTIAIFSASKLGYLIPLTERKCFFFG